MSLCCCLSWGKSSFITMPTYWRLFIWCVPQDLQKEEAISCWILQNMAKGPYAWPPINWRRRWGQGAVARRFLRRLRCWRLRGYRNCRRSPAIRNCTAQWQTLELHEENFSVRDVRLDKEISGFQAISLSHFLFMYLLCIFMSTKPPVTHEARKTCCIILSNRSRC